MITNEVGYHRTKNWQVQFEAELEELKRKYLPQRPDLYRLFSSGTIAQIEQFKRELLEYEQGRLQKAS